MRYESSSQKIKRTENIAKNIFTRNEFIWRYIRSFPNSTLKPKFRANVKPFLHLDAACITKAVALRGVGYQSMIFLTLIFTCGDGCGFPASVTLPTPYETQQQCMDAGKVWISPTANFTFAIRGYQCDPIGGTDESR